MFFLDPFHAAFRSWRSNTGPRLVVVEAAPSVPASDRRQRLAALEADAPAPITWVRPSPGGGEPVGPSAPGMAPSVGADAGPPDGAPEWSDVWRTVADRAVGGGDWVIDDAHRLPGRAWRSLLEAWAGIRGQAAPVHLALVGPPGLSARLGEIPHDRLTLAPIPAAAWLSGPGGWSAADRVRAAAIFGRSVALGSEVDPSRSVARNARKLLLSVGAPYATLAPDAVRAGVQRPDRYLRVAHALGEGVREWGGIRDAVGGLSASGQLGPYMKTLEDLGIVVGDRSLDAGPRSRSRRWRLSDPHLGFWFSCVRPGWDRLGVSDGKQIWSDVVQPRLDGHVERTLPLLFREWLDTSAAAAILGSSAREAGALWGEGYDIEVGATLRNGAIVYGWTRWHGGGFTPDEVEERLEQVRRTRYGFGRERRLKVFLQRDPPGHDLARLDARDPELFILDVSRLTSAAGARPT